MMAFVTPHTTPQSPPIPLLTASAKICSYPSPPIPTPTPVPPYHLRADVLAHPGPPSATPHTTYHTPSGLQELVVELLPSPQRCLDLIHGLLPQLASEVYQAFIAEVCTSKLTIPSLEHLVSELLQHRRSPPSTPACRSPSATWCCTLHVKVSWGCLRTECCSEDKTRPACM